MHLPDTVFLDRPAGVALVAAGAALSLAGLVWGSRGMSPAETARTGMMTAFVFVASAVPVPLGPTSTHLGLYGLAGVLLGRRVLVLAPIAFGLQAPLFGHGGLAAVGLNAVNMAAGALLARAWFRGLGGQRPGCGAGRLAAASFGAGLIGIVIMALLVLVELLAVGQPLDIAWALPIWLGTGALEGVVTVLVLGTLTRLFPELVYPDSTARSATRP